MRLRIVAFLVAFALVGAWWLTRTHTPATLTPSITPAQSESTAVPNSNVDTARPGPPSGPAAVTASETADRQTGQPRDVDETDASSVASAFASALVTWDTTTDTSPLDASRRAAGYAAPALALQLRQTPPAPPQAWTALAARRARTIATTTDGGLGLMPASSADTDTTAVRAITCTITDRASGWTQAGGDVAVIIELHRAAAGHPWSVISYQLTA